MIVLRYILLLLGSLVRRVLRRAERIDVLCHSAETRGHTEFNTVASKSAERRIRVRERRSPLREAMLLVNSHNTSQSRRKFECVLHTCYCPSQKHRASNSCCVSRDAGEATAVLFGRLRQLCLPFLLHRVNLLDFVGFDRVTRSW